MAGEATFDSRRSTTGATCDSRHSAVGRQSTADIRRPGDNRAVGCRRAVGCWPSNVVPLGCRASAVECRRVNFRRAVARWPSAVVPPGCRSSAVECRKSSFPAVTCRLSAVACRVAHSGFRGVFRSCGARLHQPRHPRRGSGPVPPIRHERPRLDQRLSNFAHKSGLHGIEFAHKSG